MTKLAKLMVITIFMVFLSSCDNSDEIKSAFQKKIYANHPEISIDKFSINKSNKNNVGVIYTASGVMTLTDNTYSTIASLGDIHVIKESFHQGDNFPFTTKFTIVDQNPTEVIINSLETKQPNYPYPLPFGGVGQLLKKFTNKTYIFHPEGNNKELISFITDIKQQKENNTKKIAQLELINQGIDKEIDDIRQEKIILSLEQKEKIKNIHDQVKEANDMHISCNKEKESYPFMGSSDSYPELRSAYEKVKEKCDQAYQYYTKIDSEKDDNISKIMKPAEDEFINRQKVRIEKLNDESSDNRKESYRLIENNRELEHLLYNISKEIDL